MPQITVIVPVYNVEPYIHRCVDSILAQTFTDFELILVDDGSPDNCGAICDRYAAQDPRIHVIHQPNGGLSAARNAGIDWAFANSDSSWLNFIDSDDWVHPRYLDTLYLAAEETSLPISSCTVLRKAEYSVDECVDVCFSVESAHDVYTQFDRKAIAYAVARLYRKEMFRNIRFPVGKIFEDVATTYKVLLQTDRIAYIPTPLYYYFFNQSGIVHQNWSPRRMDEFDAYEEQLAYLRDRPPLARTYRVVQRDYLLEISYSYYKLRDSDCPDKAEYLSALKEKMKEGLQKYAKSAGTSLRERVSYYDIAYPRQMALYWRLIALKRRVFGR